MNSTEFRLIKGYNNGYHINLFGTVLAVESGMSIYDGLQITVPKVMDPATGFLKVKLHTRGKWEWRFIHDLMQEAFCLNQANRPLVYFVDGDVTNTEIYNIGWETEVEHLERTSIEVPEYTKPLSTMELFDCAVAVIEGASYAQVAYNTGYKVPYLSTELRKVARQYSIEHLLDVSLTKQRALRAKQNGKLNKAKA